MKHGGIWLLAALTVGASASAIGVVHTKYMARSYFAQLQDLRAQRDTLDVAWNQLRLEEAALSTHVRVERKARAELGMFSPRVVDMLLIEEAGHGFP